MTNVKDKLMKLNQEGDVEIEIITTALADAKFFKIIGNEYLVENFKR